MTSGESAAPFEEMPPQATEPALTDAHAAGAIAVGPANFAMPPEEDIAAKTDVLTSAKFLRYCSWLVRRGPYANVDGADVAQDAAERVLRSQSTVTSNYLAYCKITATRVIISTRRLRNNQNTPVADVPESNEISPDHASVVELRALLAQGMEGLDPVTQRILWMRYGADMSIEEVARQLGLPIGTVKSKSFSGLRYARSRLTAE